EQLCNRRLWMRSNTTCFGLDSRSEEHTSELQSLTNLVCRLLLEKKKREVLMATSQMLAELTSSGFSGSPSRVAAARGNLWSSSAAQSRRLVSIMIFFLITRRPRTFPLFPYASFSR